MAEEAYEAETRERSGAELAADFASALADVRAGRPSAADCPEADRVAEAVAWAEANRAGGASAPCAPVVDPESDEAWFRANPGRSVRARARRDGDPLPFWLGRAVAGRGVLTVLRRWPHGGVTAEVLPLDALGGERPVDSDEGLLTALRAARGWR